MVNGYMQGDSFESGIRLQKVAFLILVSAGLLISPCAGAEPDSVHVSLAQGASAPTLCDELATIIPSLEINNGSIEEATDLLTKQSKIIDPDQIGMSFVVDPDAVETSRPITIYAHNLTLFDALHTICKLGNVKAKIVGSQIHLVSMRESVDAMQQPSIDQTVSHHLIVRKLQAITIDKVNLKKMDIAGVLKFLAQKTKQSDPDKKGINFVLGYIAPTDNVQRQVTLTTSNITLGELVVVIGQQTNLRYFVEDGAVYFKP